MDYLHRCCDLHAELTEIGFGRRQDLGDIERAVAHVRSSRQLTYDDIEKIKGSRDWIADLFGYWPSRTEIESILDPGEWDFWNLPKREDKAITALVGVFRQVELASVVLRFIVPEHYGILSPPVETVLGLGPYPRREDRYKAYLHNLRELQLDRGLATAAMADMALWVLQVGVVDGLLHEHRDYEMLQDAYQNDARLRAIQVGNLTSRLFNDLSRPDLAEALLGTNAEWLARSPPWNSNDRSRTWRLRTRTTCCAKSSTGFAAVCAQTPRWQSAGPKPSTRAIELFTPEPRPRSEK